MISDKRFIVYDYELKTVAYAYIRKVKSPLVIGLTSECRKSRIVGDNGRIVPLKVLHCSSSSCKLNIIYNIYRFFGQLWGPGRHKSSRLKSNLLAYTKTLVELIIRLQY